LETFGSCLVSSLAVSGNRRRRSRNNRHRRRNASLSGEREIHTEGEDSTSHLYWDNEYSETVAVVSLIDDDRDCTFPSALSGFGIPIR
jgi:hypothetical protein